ncbi:hypothetical protein AX16_007433 [Volvariella volvacea WC 439]|nr:hypothetical protein AX16_007433 [Volvariella volvacea WC 439]
MPTTIFWPKHLVANGFCYGWSQPVVCVAAVLPLDTEQEAEGALSRLINTPRWHIASRIGAGSLQVLGTCAFDSAGHLSFKFFSVRQDDCHLIYYHRHPPESLRFYSLEGLRLDAAERTGRSKRDPFAELLQFDFAQPSPRNEGGGLNQSFNLASTVEALLQQKRQVNLRSTLSSAILSSAVYVGRPLAPNIINASHWLAWFCNLSVVAMISGPRLKDISALIQQFDVRAEQAEYLVSETRVLRQPLNTPLPQYVALYTNFFNTVWLLINDFSIGYTFGMFLCDYHQLLANSLLGIIDAYFISWVQWSLRWLDSWPAGLKLNTELSRFCSHTFIKVVALWGDVLHSAAPSFSTLIFLAGVMSCMGSTFLISICMDTLALLTVHIYLCYLITNFIYQKMLQTAGSLWNLFRGKRYNVLRNRIDNWEYDMDQLLFGTILFTLLAFLFPTVLAYHALFSLMRLGTILLQACMETLLAFMNHFPLFALMLRVKDPWRLPGGVYVSLTLPEDNPMPHLTIENQPIALSSIFFQYIRLSSLLASHYNPLRLVYCVLSGKFISAIPRYHIRYNKLPSQPKGIVEGHDESSSSVNE